VGDYVELDVTTLGVNSPNVTNGQDLKVDYLFRREGSLETDYFLQLFRIEQEFDNGISVYYSNRRTERDFESSVEDLTGEEQIMDIFGIRYSRANYYLSAEHSALESTNNTSVSDTIMASGHWPLSPKTSLHGRVSQAWIESSGDRDKETSLFRIEGEVKTRLSRYLRLSSDAELRRETQSDLGRTDGWRFGAAFEYKRRALSLRAGYDYYFLDRYGREKTSSEIYVRLIRRF
jgi:outer membrane cobalamin receptor